MSACPNHSITFLMATCINTNTNTDTDTLHCRRDESAPIFPNKETEKIFGGEDNKIFP